MKSDKDILRERRRENLRVWFVGRTFPEQDRSYISQLLSGKTESFGEKAARRLEKDNGMPHMYLDQPCENNISHSSSGNTDLIKDTKDSSHLHRIDYFDVYAAAGLNGFENADYPEIISSLFLSDEGMAQLIGRKSSNGICLVNVPTDSMEPTIRKGDLVFLDTNVNFYNGDGIYAFVIDGALFIKRIQKLVGGGYRLHSDNKNGYDPQDITEDIYQSAKFIGRFIRTIHVEAVNL